MTLPLQGIVVADFSRVLAGPYAAATLGDLGARVIKVEQPGKGDDTRSWGPPWSSDSSAYFDAANRNKESISLNLADDEDHRTAMEIIRRSDVFLENFRPDTLEQFSLTYGNVSAVNPGIVHCAISGFGRKRGASRPGYDLMVQAASGLMSITGSPEEEGGRPTKVGIPIVDILASKDALIGILTALHYRHKSGRGQLVEVNLLSSAIAALTNQAANYFAEGRIPVREGNTHPSIAPYEVYECEEGELVVACGNDHQFLRLARALSRPEIGADGRFNSNSQRVANRESLRALLQPILLRKTARAWAEELTSAGIPVSPVNSIEEGIRLATDLGLVPVTYGRRDESPQLTHPIAYSNTPVTSYKKPPQLGADEAKVRAWLSSLREIAQ